MEQAQANEPIDCVAEVSVPRWALRSILVFYCLDSTLRGLVLYEFKLGPETAVGTVVEGSERWAGEVILHIARIPVVSNIEDSYSYPASVLFTAERNLQAFHYQQVQRQQSGKAPAAVPRPHVILLLIKK